MDGAQRHDAQLLMMYSALKAKRDRLMKEVAEVDRDLDAVWRTASIELHNRQASAASGGTTEPQSVWRTSSVELRQQKPTASHGKPVLALPVLSGADGGSEADTGGEQQPKDVTATAPEDDGPVVVTPGTPFESRSVPPAPETLAALATLGPVRDDIALPPTVDAKGQRLEVAGMPTGGAELAAAKAAVRDIADQARKAPPGKGGRKLMSSRGLVPGEPLMPALRNVLKVARRPLTSLEATLAMLNVRGLRYEGPELVAVVNRVSALFSQEAKKGNMRGTKQAGTRARLWKILKTDEGSLDAKAHMRGASSHPSGSTG